MANGRTVTGMLEDKDILERAKKVIGEKNISDWRPTVIGNYDEVVYALVPNAITIWLNNGDVLIYKYID